MVMADDGELIILAPGLKEFGEDAEIDRAHPQVRLSRHARDAGGGQANAELRNNLSAARAPHSRFEPKAASLISLLSRPGMSQEAIRSGRLRAGDLDAALKRYNPIGLERTALTACPDSERSSTVSNPAWAFGR